MRSFIPAGRPPPGDNSAGMSYEEREFAIDMNIGTYHFRNKNYRGAEFRFRHALEYKPGQPDATFKVAETLRKLGKNDEAGEEYRTYLKAQPNGPYGEKLDLSWIAHRKSRAQELVPRPET